MTITVKNYKEENYRKVYDWYVKQCGEQWMEPIDYERYKELVEYYQVLRIIEFNNL